MKRIKSAKTTRSLCKSLNSGLTLTDAAKKAGLSRSYVREKVMKASFCFQPLLIADSRFKGKQSPVIGADRTDRKGLEALVAAMNNGATSSEATILAVSREGAAKTSVHWLPHRPLNSGFTARQSAWREGSKTRRCAALAQGEPREESEANVCLLKEGVKETHLLFSKTLLSQVPKALIGAVEHYW